MKRFFRNLKTLAMCALVGVATLAVSCSEAYDDTLIKQDIEDLKNRVEALEIKLTNEVNALKALIAAEVAELEGAVAAVDAKIAILDYTANADGSYTLTTKGGENITIYPQFTENNDNLLTVMTDGRGDYYWAQIVNGVPVALTDANGNKYYVHNATQLPVIPEATQVRQDADGANEVSFDGGQTWYKLGGGGDLGLFQSVTVSEDGKSLTFVLNGGQSFTTSLPEEFSFSVDGNKLFFTAAQAKTVLVKTTGIKDLAVVSVPAGWKASIEGGVKLNVTAPSAEAVAGAVAEEAGVVYVLAISNEGKAVLGKLAVSAGKGYTLEIKMANAPVLDEWGYPEYDENWDILYAEQLSLVVTNEQIVEMESYGDKYLVYNTLVYGMTPKADFSVEALKNGGLMDMYGGSYEYPYFNDEVYDNEIAQWYYGPEGEGWYAYDYDTYEYVLVDTTNLPAKESAVALSAFGEITPGVEYVLWAMPWSQGASWMDPNTLYYEDLVYETYVQRIVEAKQVDATTSDIQIDVTVAGYESYLVLGGNSAYIANNWTETFDYWQMGYTNFGMEKTESTFSGSFFDFIMNPEDYEHESGVPGTEYMLCILPLEAGKAPADYTYADVLVYTFKTENLQGGGVATPTITLDFAGYADINMILSAPEAETSMIYYKAYRAAAWNDSMLEWTDDAWVTALLTGGSMTTKTEMPWNYSFTVKDVTVGETVHFVAFAVDKQGKYGEVTIEAFSTKCYTGPSEDFVVTIGQISSTTDGEIVIPISANKEVAYYKYIVTNPGNYWTKTLGGTVESITEQMAVGGFGNKLYPNKLVDGKYVANYSFATYNVAIIAFDAEMNVSSAAIVENYEHKWKVDYLYPDEEGYELGEPTLTFELLDSYESSEPQWSSYTVNVKVTPAEGTKAYVACFSEDYEETYNTEYDLLKYVATRVYDDTEYIQWGYTLATDTEATYLLKNDTVIFNDTYVYYTWTTEGENGPVYRTCKKINLRDALNIPHYEEDEEE